MHYIVIKVLENAYRLFIIEVEKVQIYEQKNNNHKCYSCASW